MNTLSITDAITQLEEQGEPLQAMPQMPKKSELGFKVGPAKSTFITDRGASLLFDIACVAKALAKKPEYEDQERILNCLRAMLENSEAEGLFIPESGFAWRAEEWSNTAKIYAGHKRK